MKQKAHQKTQKLIKLEPGQIYYVALWDTYSNSKSLWVGEEDLDDFMGDRIFIELVGWFYKEDKDFYFFYAMANRVEKDREKINQISYLTAIPKKAVISLTKFIGRCYK